MHGGQLKDGMADELESVTPAGRELAGTVLEAFTRHRLVGIGESHGLQNHHDALQMLFTDPRLPRRSTTSSSSSATRATRTRWTGS